MADQTSAASWFISTTTSKQAYQVINPNIASIHPHDNADRQKFAMRDNYALLTPVLHPLPSFCISAALALPLYRRLVNKAHGN